MRKIIPDFPDYSIDTEGNVYRETCEHRATQGKRKTPKLGKNGYYSHNLYKDKKAYTRTIHRLVLETFVGPKPKGKVCRHLNGNAKDNRLENLAWGTYKENAQDKIKHGTQQKGEKVPNVKLTQREAKEIYDLAANCAYSMKYIATLYDISPSNVQSIKEQKTWKHIHE